MEDAKKKKVQTLMKDLGNPEAEEMMEEEEEDEQPLSVKGIKKYMQNKLAQWGEAESKPNTKPIRSVGGTRG